MSTSATGASSPTPDRARESIVLDFTGIAGLTNGDLVYLFVERRDYNNAAYEYRGSTDIDANLVAKDLRKLQTGSDGVIGSDKTVFTSIEDLKQHEIKLLVGDSPLEAVPLALLNQSDALQAILRLKERKPRSKATAPKAPKKGSKEKAPSLN